MKTTKSRMQKAALAVALLMVPGSFIVLGLMGLFQGAKLMRAEDPA